MTQSRVAVVRSSPETILDDIARAMRSVQYQEHVKRDKDTALKINISWQKFYPACSTPPWQIDGVVHALLADGYRKELIHACHNDTVVVNAREGERANRQLSVVEMHGLRNVHLYDDPDWVVYEPKGKLLVLDQVYPKGIRIPRRFIGENIIQLPTMKTHVFTTITGAMKNAFGGLLHRQRHWTHAVIHETLVDLLTIQKEIHTGLFAVMDAHVVGSGPGPRCMELKPAGYVLASADQVAIDAVAARMMGFDPLSLPFIRLAHEHGLGAGDLREIEIVGESIEGVDLGCAEGSTFASRGQHALYHGLFKPLERLLTHTPLVVLCYLASWAYHDWYWYPAIGRRRVAEYMRSPWGRLFESYPRPGEAARTAEPALAVAR